MYVYEQEVVKKGKEIQNRTHKKKRINKKWAKKYGFKIIDPVIIYKVFNEPFNRGIERIFSNEYEAREYCYYANKVKDCI